MAGKKGMRHYSVALKEQAVQLALETKQSYPEIATQLQLRHPERIGMWVRAYRKEGLAGLCKPQGRPRQTPSTDLVRLQLENLLLKKWHSELRIPMHAKRNIGSSSTIEPPFR